MGVLSYLKRGIRYVINGIPQQHITVNIQTLQPQHLLEGKNIVITGGGRGLGFFIAQRCVNEGAQVLITGRNEEVLLNAIDKLGSAAKHLVFDVTDTHIVEDFFVKASKAFNDGKIDCLVSNAGISLHEKDFRSVTEDGWDTQMNTNLKGNYFLVSKYIQYLEKQDNTAGNIVVISSERSQRPDDIPYGLTKVATNSFIKAFASKVIEKGIRINGVAPGVTASDMTGFDLNSNLFADYQPMKRVFRPEEVAEVVNFLLSDISACISGEIITCDQGRYISHW